MKKTKNILEKLKHLKEKGLSGKEIAESLGISQATYYTWIRQLEIEEQKKYQQPIFPDGESAIMSYRAYKDKKLLIITKLNRSITTLSYEVEEYRDLIHKLQHEMNETALHFCEANKGRNLKPEYMDYMEKYRMYYSDEHQEAIKIAFNLIKQQTLDISDSHYKPFLYLNQFLDLSKEEIKEFQRNISTLANSVPLSRRENINPTYSEQRNFKVKQYGIYYHNFNGSGCIQNGLRPCVVVSNDKGNTASNIAIVVPITSKTKRFLPTHVSLQLGVPSTILCEQLITVNQEDLQKTDYELNEYDKIRLQEALMVSLGYKTNTVKESIIELLDLKKEVLKQKSELEKQCAELETEIENKKIELLKLQIQSTKTDKEYFK